MRYLPSSGAKILVPIADDLESRQLREQAGGVEEQANITYA
jgi:hypothetical protein